MTGNWIVWVGALSFGLVVVLFFVQLFLSARLLALLRSQHPKLWRDLGEPTLILGTSIRNDLRLQRFLRRREYDALGDPALSKLATSVRTISLIYSILFVISLVAWLIVLVPLQEGL
jgi:hypothetical protein